MADRADADTTSDAADDATLPSSRPRRLGSRPRPPSVERLLTLVRPRRPPGQDPQALVATCRMVVQAERARLAASPDATPARSPEALADDVIALLEAWAGPPTGTVINATGVIIHTNLGRAPWADEAVAAAIAASGSLLLELDRASGRRGARFRAAEEHLIALTGGADALLVNNNAAAVALAVGLAGRGGRVVVSRGELVEIGGGVRIPEIVRRAGARLVEVGTTNRTRAADYAVALDAGATVVLRVHPSNFVQSGFTESPDARSLAELAHRHGAIVIDDLGSGALLPTDLFGLAHEPTPAERLAAGADLVTFSGDKLVGGPQAGFIVGRADLIARLRRDPLARAMRPDKVTLAAVAATLGLFRAGLAAERIPVWRMIAASVESLRDRAQVVADAVNGAPGTRTGPATSAGRPVPEAVAKAIDTTATLGGGSLPGERLASVAVAISAPGAGGPERLLAFLRAGEPVVVGRIENRRALFDLRSVTPIDDAALSRAIVSALRGHAAVGRGR